MVREKDSRLSTLRDSITVRILLGKQLLACVGDAELFPALRLSVFVFMRQYKRQPLGGAVTN